MKKARQKTRSEDVKSYEIREGKTFMRQLETQQKQKIK